MVTRHITCLLLYLLGAMTLLSVGCTSCRIGLHEETRANVTQAFASSLERGNDVVRFHLYIRDNATTEPVEYYKDKIMSGSNFTTFGAKGIDTFAPYLWVWARENGKYILRVPMDYHVLSLGTISYYIANMEVPLVTDDLNCTEEIPYEEVQNMVATLLYDEVVHVGDIPITDVITRSAYIEGSLGRIIGVKGCNRNPTTGNFSCESLDYMKGWQMTWYFPIAIILCLYFAILITLWKEYFKYQELRGEGKNLRIKVSIIEQKILRDVTRIRRQLYGAPVEENFIAYRDSVKFFDILGVSQKKQRKVVIAVQVMVSIVLLGGYYGIMGYSIYYHSLPRQQTLLQLIEDSREMYGNVFGHLAWLFAAETNTGMRTYALVEAWFTGLMPLLMIFLFITYSASRQNVDVILPEKKAEDEHIDNADTLELRTRPIEHNDKVDTLELGTRPTDRQALDSDLHTTELDLHTTELNRHTTELDLHTMELDFDPGELDIPTGNIAKKETKEFGVVVHYKGCYHKFANSLLAKILCVLVGFIVICFWLGFGLVYMVYSMYMIGVGCFLTANLFAGWLLPACLSIYYAYDVFTPLFEFYTVSKNAVFTEIHKRGYLVKTDEYMLAPTSIIEKFYYARSREQLFEGFRRVFVGLSIFFMIFLIFIASQYPDFDIRTKNSNLVMGVNIAIILPFLAKVVQPRTPLSDFEKEILSKDVQSYLDDWEAENEAMVEALKLRVQKLQKVSRMPSTGNTDLPIDASAAAGVNLFDVTPAPPAAAVKVSEDGTDGALAGTVRIFSASTKDAMDKIIEAPESSYGPKQPSTRDELINGAAVNGVDDSNNNVLEATIPIAVAPAKGPTKEDANGGIDKITEAPESSSDPNQPTCEFVNEVQDKSATVRKRRTENQKQESKQGELQEKTESKQGALQEKTDSTSF